MSFLDYLLKTKLLIRGELKKCDRTSFLKLFFSKFNQIEQLFTYYIQKVSIDSIHELFKLDRFSKKILRFHMFLTMFIDECMNGIVV